jgi:DNA-binding NarL/FixJ family response regulator
VASPPDDGLRAAVQIRERFAATGVLVLSHHLESRYAMHLLERQPERAGYLLKDRVSDVALRRIADGECVLDPTIVARLLHRFDSGPLNHLTERKHEVLSLMAEGHSNQGLSTHLRLSQQTVETHVRNIFLKLGIPEPADYHRRVLAVLTLLRAG